MKSTSSLTTSKPPRLRAGLKDVTPEEFSAALNAQLGKQRVSIMLDGSIIAFFKAKAGERGYQTHINQALHQTWWCGVTVEKPDFTWQTLIIRLY